MRKNLRWPPTVVWPLKKSCCCFEKEMREKVFLRAEEPHRGCVCVGGRWVSRCCCCFCQLWSPNSTTLTESRKKKVWEEFPPLFGGCTATMYDFDHYGLTTKTTDFDAQYTLRKKGAYAWRKVPVKCFKIWHISYNYNTKTHSCFFHLVLLYICPLMNALVYVDIDQGIH